MSQTGNDAFLSTPGEGDDRRVTVFVVDDHDVVLMDLVLPLKPGTEPTDQGGMQATRLIRQVSPRTQVEAILHPRIARRPI